LRVGKINQTIKNDTLIKVDVKSKIDAIAFIILGILK
jgi:hypothetical protein